MTSERTVKEIVVPQAASDGAGVQLKRSIATATLDHLDPFFLFDHFGSENPDDYIAGFPMHPHRGIETITYMLDGSVSHRDSIGNAGTIHAGDVQWMTAGRGIMHEEMPHAGPKRLDGSVRGFPSSRIRPRERKSTRWQTSTTSAMLCDVHRTPVPSSAASARIWARASSAEAGSREAVGRSEEHTSE